MSFFFLKLGSCGIWGIPGIPAGMHNLAPNMLKNTAEYLLKVQHAMGMGGGGKVVKRDEG